MSTSVFFQVKVETVDPPNLSTARARALPPKDLGKKIPEAFKPPEPAKPPESFKPPEPAKPPFKRPEPAFKPPEVIATPRVIAPAQVFGGWFGSHQKSVGILGKVKKHHFEWQNTLIKSCAVVHLQYLSPIFSDSMSVAVDFGRFFFGCSFSLQTMQSLDSIPVGSTPQGEPGVFFVFSGWNSKRSKGFYDTKVGCHPWINLGWMLYFCFAPSKKGDQVIQSHLLIP